MRSKSEIAQEKFLQGYNCAQAVLIAFCKEAGMDERQAARFASSFGGGMGQLHEVCGTVSAMFMVAGVAAGYDDPADKGKKNAHYANIRALAKAFVAKDGSILCRDLLKNAKSNVEAVADAHTRERYARRPCLKYVADAAELMEAFLARQAGETA